MSNIYLGAGKGDTPRSCNSDAYLKNYKAIKWIKKKEIKDDKDKK